MRKTWTILCAAALLALTLAGCAGNRTQGSLDDVTNTPSPSPSLAPSVKPDDIHGTEEAGDLAGADGMVDGEGTDDGVVDNDVDRPGQADNSPLEEAGDAIRDTVDDLGDTARNALDDLGAAARDAGRDAKGMLENH